MINFSGVKRRISRIFKPQQPITFFEVKELYNLAYEQKAQARNALRQYRRIEARARALDESYRSQLGLIGRAA